MKIIGMSVVAIALGCGKSAGPSTESGAGSGTNAPAAAAPQDAPNDAAPADAAVLAAADPARTVIARPVDAKLAARLPSAPVLLAASGESLVIAKLDRTGLHQIYNSNGGNGYSLAWVDPRTLIVFEPDPGTDEPPLVRRFVDGVEAESRKIVEGDFGATTALARGPELLATRNGEAWLGACLKEGEIVNESLAGPPCLQPRYLRVHPAPNQLRSKPPGGVESNLTLPASEQAWPRVPDAAAPAGVRLKLAPIVIPRSDDGGGMKRYGGVVCESPAGKSSYPDETLDPSNSYIARSVRWVQATPPIYEITAKLTDPVEQVHDDWKYQRACAKGVLAGFYGLGNGIWAELVPTGDALQYWTVRVDNVELGSIPGSALRTSRLITTKDMRP